MHLSKSRVFDKEISYKYLKIPLLQKTDTLLTMLRFATQISSSKKSPTIIIHIQKLEATKPSYSPLAKCYIGNKEKHQQMFHLLIFKKMNISDDKPLPSFQQNDFLHNRWSYFYQEIINEKMLIFIIFIPVQSQWQLLHPL